MKFNAKKIIKTIRLLPEDEKEKVFNFIILERSKNFSAKEKKIINFGIKSTSKLQLWNKKAQETLLKNKRFIHDLNK